jgi:hypothetical protein
MSEGDAFWKSPRKDRRIDPSGLNLAREGLLLVMRVEGHRDSKTKAHPRTQILMSLHPEMNGGHAKPRCRREVTPEVILALEVSRWRRGHAGGHPRTRGIKMMKGLRQRSTRSVM